MRVLFCLAVSLGIAVYSTVTLGASVKIADYAFSGVWQGAAYRADTGEFSHCVASADYQSDTTLFVYVDFDFSWRLGFANPGWNIKNNAPVVSYRFDGGPWFDATAERVEPEFMMLPMSSESTLIGLFRRGHVMELSFEEGTYGFNLEKTFLMIADLATCVGTYAPNENEVPPPKTASVPSTVSGGVSREKAATGTGTGFVVSEDGYILTNHHVVKGCAALTVTASGDTARPASLIRSDTQNDLALLRVQGPFDPQSIATFRVGSSVRAGDAASVYGFPLYGALSASGNIVAGNVTSLSGLGDDVRFYQVSTPVQPGNSGGPLMDEAGLVIGVVNARMDDVAVLDATGAVPQNINFAIKGSVAQSFLEAHSIPYGSSMADKAKSLADVAERAKEFSVLITCM